MKKSQGKKKKEGKKKNQKTEVYYQFKR